MKFHRFYRNIFLAATDMLCVCGFLLLTVIPVYLTGNEELLKNTVYLLIIPAVILLSNNLSGLYGGHFFYPGIGIGKVQELKYLTLSVFIGYASFFAFAVLTGRGNLFPLKNLLCSFVFTLPMTVLCRFTCRHFLNGIPGTRTRVLIAGAGKNGRAVAREITRDNYYGFEVAGFLDDNCTGNDIAGPVSRAVEIAVEKQINFLIICMPPQHLTGYFNTLLSHFHHIVFASSRHILPIMWTRSLALGYTSAFEINNRLQFKMFLFCKKIIEIALALLMLPFIAIIGSVIAVLIKVTSAGPVFYRADRIGKNGRKIRILKFRTMYRNADDILEEILENDPVLKKEWLEKFKLTDDPRITPLGKFLRKTSLDELPQFWNVLTGDMAIIGPRPIVEAEKHYYGVNFHVFSVVKPGITGLWQISGRNDLDYSERVNLDVYYVRNWSLWLDYFIFLKTIVNVLARRGAY